MKANICRPPIAS